MPVTQIFRRLVAIGGGPPPSVPTLAVADLMNGTGATATISGGSADATHNIYVGNFAGGIGAIARTLAGSRVGNGTVNLALAKGFYVAMVEAVRSDDIVAGNTVYFAVTDGVDAVHYRCLTAIQADVQALALTAIPGANVVVRWLPRLREQEGNVIADPTPLVVIAPPGPEMMLGGLNTTDDIGYPCIVAFFDKDPDLANNMSRNLLWRELAINSLREQRLAGVPEVEKVEIIPDAVVDLAAWREQYWVSAFVARCIARQTRG